MRFTLGRPAAATALAAVAALTLAACGSGSSDDASKGDGGISLKNSGKLTVCSDIPYEPFEFVQDGKNVGFDLDIADKIAEKLDVETNIIDASFDSIESGLFKTQCDIAISGVSITDARKQNMNFSDPYMDDDLVLVAKDGSGIDSVAAAKGKKVAVQQSTTGEEYAKDNGLTPTGYEDSGLQVQSLKSGQTQAALGNQSILRYATKDDSSLKVVEEIKTGEQLGVAVPTGEDDLLDAVNETLKDLESDGGMDELKKKWFGDDAA
ncbi:MAG: ABC transporter substrate-binding protein [Galactobacter sp.]